MGAWTIIQVAGGMMIGTTIVLFFIVRRVVEIERTSEALMLSLVSELEKRTSVEKVEPGVTSTLSGISSTKSNS
jgi:hypothetical protein